MFLPGGSSGAEIGDGTPLLPYFWKTRHRDKSHVLLGQWVLASEGKKPSRGGRPKGFSKRGFLFLIKRIKKTYDERRDWNREMLSTGWVVVRILSCFARLNRPSPANTTKAKDGSFSFSFLFPPLLSIFQLSEVGFLTGSHCSCRGRWNTSFERLEHVLRGRKEGKGEGGPRERRPGGRRARAVSSSEGARHGGGRRSGEGRGLVSRGGIEGRG